MGSRETAFIVFTVIYFIIIIVGVSLFGSSFSIVDINRVALFRNKFSVQIEQGKVYMSGRLFNFICIIRYFTGLGGEFIDYPTTWQYIDFSNEDGCNNE